MVDSLRSSRYPRYNNTNKHYTMYFDVDQVNMNSKSRTKKRDSPKKRFLNKTLEEEEKHSKSKDEIAAKRDDVLSEHVQLVKSESYESEEVEESGGKRKFSPTSTTTSLYEQQERRERRQDNEQQQQQHSEQKRPDSRPATGAESEQENPTKKLKGNDEKDQMFELFQPWALKTYGDQAKTKTITLKKKSRILKALNGKEHNNPDSSKFRFWVKSKGFTTQRPDSYRISGNSSSSNASQDADGTREDLIDLYVASMTKDFGERTFKKVAVVEEFFNIIYNVHVDFGGRNGRHAGQKRTYRIITETYAFLPREAVTKFLSGCPACKKNLRPFSPSKFDDNFTESSSEFDVLNYSSQNDSSIDSIGSAKILLNTQKDIRYSVVSPANFKQDEKDDKNVCFREKLHTLCAVVEPFHKSEQISYFEDISAKFCNYYKNYGGYPNLGDIRHDNILNYYQYLKKYSAIPSPLSRQSPPISLCSSSVAKNTVNDSISSRKSPLEDLSRFKPISNVQKQQLNIFTPPTSPLVKDCPNEPRIDFNIVQTKNSPDNKFPQSININIEESTDSSARGTCPAFKPQSESNLFIKSVDVSINMTSHNIDQLKISCKTTPPKKRYSIYKPTPQSDSDNHQCAINLSKKMDRHSTKCDLTKEVIRTESPPGNKDTQDNSIRVDLDRVKPITSTYLKWTRSMGLSDADALQIDDLETLPTPASDTVPDQNSEEAYAGLMKDADKLKLMLLAWNYQNSNAVRNGAEAPDLGVVGGLWAQYQNALALNTKQPSVSPVHRPEQSSPIENQDETNSSGQKDEDDGSEDDSDDKLDQNAQDPERLKAFNMFVRLFVDENLDRMIPISKQPKEKIQAIIDSCARQFPEFCERSRKRIRTYLKSCRRNKKAREGWDNASRPTPAHLTSVQAEQILAIACENESMNAKRMRVGLDPISQAMPLPSGSTNSIETIAPSTQYPGFRTTPNTTVSTSEPEGTTPSTTAQSANPSRNSPLSLSVTGNEAKPLTVVAASTTTNSQVSSPLYRPADFTSPSSTSSPYSSRPQTYPPFFSTTGTVNATPTDLSMKQHQSQQPPQSLSSSGISPNNRPPIVTHKLSANEITAARQVITAYRESAAFLLRTADQVEQLLLQQQ